MLGHWRWTRPLTRRRHGDGQLLLLLLLLDVVYGDGVEQQAAVTHGWRRHSHEGFMSRCSCGVLRVQRAVVRGRRLRVLRRQRRRLLLQGRRQTLLLLLLLLLLMRVVWVRVERGLCGAPWRRVAHLRRRHVVAGNLWLLKNHFISRRVGSSRG